MSEKMRSLMISSRCDRNCGFRYVLLLFFRERQRKTRHNKRTPVHYFHSPNAWDRRYQTRATSRSKESDAVSQLEGNDPITKVRCVLAEARARS